MKAIIYSLDAMLSIAISSVFFALLLSRLVYFQQAYAGQANSFRDEIENASQMQFVASIIDNGSTSGTSATQLPGLLSGFSVTNLTIAAECGNCTASRIIAINGALSAIHGG
ncbi:MAG: hypothetical protein KGH98_03525 [Candidatus Micrarchaeota archaeon]|nr:hypothetical protein [Candidatus Micrarchaeota archaeon]